MMQTNKGLQNKIVTERILRLEREIKLRMNNNYETVRKAFLALDTDHDGFLTVEDFLRNYGDIKDIKYYDLKKLIYSKTKDSDGKISYEDFSSWVGNAIHMSEGFYFRHDSTKNPGFEKLMNKKEKEVESLNQIR